MSALLPCPFCGKSVACVSDTNELRVGMSFMHTVVCDSHKGGCGAAVGFDPEQEGAIAAWNRRPTPEPQGEAVAWIPEQRLDVCRTAFSATCYFKAAIGERGVPDRLVPLYTRPQPGEGGGEVTDEMVNVAWDAWNSTKKGSVVIPAVAMRAALTAALSKGGQGG